MIRIDKSVSVYLNRSINNDKQNQKGLLPRYEYPLDYKKHVITSDFGYRTDPFHGKKTFHNGIDFRGKRGDKVLAAANSKVVAAGWHNGLGYYVKLKHDDGNTSIYAHMDKNPSKYPTKLRCGMSITAGQIIGSLGNTGRSTGPHLHFEMRDRNNHVINPLLVLPEFATPQQKLQKFIADNLGKEDCSRFMAKNFSKSSQYFDGQIRGSSRKYLDALISKLSKDNNLIKLHALDSKILNCGKSLNFNLDEQKVLIASAMHSIRNNQDNYMLNLLALNTGHDFNIIDEALMNEGRLEDVSIELSNSDLQDSIYKLLPKRLKNHFRRHNLSKKGTWDGIFDKYTYRAINYLSFALPRDQLVLLVNDMKSVKKVDKSKLRRYITVCDKRIAAIKLQETIRDLLPDKLLVAFEKQNLTKKGAFDGIIGPSTSKYLKVAMDRNNDPVVKRTLMEFVARS